MPTILVIDDDLHLLKMLRFTLERAGFSMLEASDGETGIQIAAENPFDLAVVDIMMPGMDGYEVCRQLRSLPQAADRPILVLTARSQAIDRQTALQAGADDFLSKPVTPDELIEKIRTLLATPRKPRPVPQAQSSGKLIVCWGPAAGMGVSSLSLNLSIAFALWQRRPIGLIDLREQAEPIPLAQRLGVRPQQTLAEIIPALETLTPDTLRQALTPHPSGVHLLPAPPRTIPIPPPAIVERLLALIRAAFSLTLVDLPATSNAGVQTALRLADHHVLIFTPTVAHVRLAWQSFHHLTSRIGLSPDQITLVVNHTSNQAEIPPAEIRRGLARPIVTIPHTPAMREASNTGRPLLVAQPTLPACRAIASLAMQIGKAMGLA